MFKLVPIVVLIIAAVEYLRRINRGIEDMLELQWHMLDAFKQLAGLPGGDDVFVARSGRLVRRKRV